MVSLTGRSLVESKEWRGPRQVWQLYDENKREEGRRGLYIKKYRGDHPVPALAVHSAVVHTSEVAVGKAIPCLSIRTRYLAR